MDDVSCGPEAAARWWRHGFTSLSSVLAMRTVSWQQLGYDGMVAACNELCFFPPHTTKSCHDAVDRTGNRFRSVRVSFS